MADKLKVKDLKKLLLEERAQIVLQNYSQGKKGVEGENGTFASFQPYLEAWAYLEKNNFVELIGGTPKSGARYRITEEGNNFMRKSI